jgi:DHA2 family multidrug resistance protein
MVERESTVLAYIDGFWLTFWFAVCGIAFIALIGASPSVRFVPVPFREWLGLRRSRPASSPSQK